MHGLGTKLTDCNGEDIWIDFKTTTIVRDETEKCGFTIVSLLPLVYCDAGVNDLDDLLRSYDHSALVRATYALSRARSVVVITTQEDRSILVLMQSAAARCTFNWRFHEGLRDEGEGPSLDLDSANVVVVISTAPHHPYNALAAGLARNGGARVIGITDARESAVGHLAHDVLIVPVPKRGLFKSYVAAAALVEMLVHMAAGRRGGREAPGAKRESDGRYMKQGKWFVSR